MVYDLTTQQAVPDETIEKIAKAQIAGEDMPVTKADWIVAIEERAEKVYADLPLSLQQKFSKCIGASAWMEGHRLVDQGDDLGRLYYEALKVAPNEPIVPEQVQDFQKAIAVEKGEAHARMHALAIDSQRARGGSYERSYARVYSATENQALRNKVKSEHLAATLRSMQGDTEGQDELEKPYTNPHPTGSGPRPRA